MELAAGTIKKVTLELGGKSPNIVFPDADLDEAVDGSLFAIFTNAGQRCTARTRLFLHRIIHDQFLSEFVRKARQDPRRRSSRARDADGSGHLAHAGQPHPLLLPARGEDGAELVAGGKRITDGDLAAGNFLAPTVFDGVRHDMHLAQEEVFGPVLAVIPFTTEDEVVPGGQHHDLRSGRDDLDERHQARPHPGAANPGRQRQHQLPDGQPARGAFRRLQAERSRPRAEPPRHGSLHPDQERRGEPQPAAVRLVRSLARGAKAVGRRSPLQVTTRSGSTIAGRRVSSMSLRGAPERDPTGRSILWLPSSTIRVYVPWHRPPLPCLPTLPCLSSLPTSVRSSSRAPCVSADSVACWGMVRRPSADFRERLVTAIDAGLPPGEAATHFRVSIRTIYRWLARHRRGEALTERPRSGRPPKLPSARYPELREIVLAQPDATLPEHAARLATMTGIHLSPSHLSRLLAKLELPLKKRA